MILFFDTETTGIVDKKLPDSDPSQPRLVQLAALLCDDAGNDVMSISVVIRPDNFEIPIQASNVHGITTEIANKVGISLKVAVSMFNELKLKANLIVAHNYFFDKTVINGEMCRIGLNPLDIEFFCTMLATTPICKIPTKYGAYKWPKLMEAHVHLLGEGFDDAHDALADVQACKRVYFKLKEIGKC